MKLENQEWSTFLNTRKAGGYTIARNGWVCAYNDPIAMLDMWITSSGNNDCQFGKGAHKDVRAYSIDLTDLGYDTKVTVGTWAETYDVITGAICPLYYYTDLYMLDDSVKGFFSTPLGFKYFMYCTVDM